MKVLEQINFEYGDFHDAIIVEFNYDSGFDFNNKKISTDKIRIKLSCFNINKEFSKSNELIEIICYDIKYFKFLNANFMIFQALLEKNDTDEYILDFDPIITTDRETGKEWISKENENSDLIIKCKNIEFKKLA